MIGARYRHEKIIRDHRLDGECALDYRARHSQPIVRAFWRWFNDQCLRPDLLPCHPLAEALNGAKAVCRNATPGSLSSAIQVP